MIHPPQAHLPSFRTGRFVVVRGDVHLDSANDFAMSVRDHRRDTSRRAVKLEGRVPKNPTNLRRRLELRRLQSATTRMEVADGVSRPVASTEKARRCPRRRARRALPVIEMLIFRTRLLQEVGDKVALELVRANRSRLAFRVKSIGHTKYRTCCQAGHWAFEGNRRRL